MKDEDGNLVIEPTQARVVRDIYRWYIDGASILGIQKLNSEYFCTVLHMLRDDVSYRAIVDRIVEVSDNAYVRHTEAVKRIATAYLKLLFPQWRRPEDVDMRLFNRYCLRPAVNMRKIIWRQMSILDSEYKNENKQMPTFSLRNIENEV